MVTFFFFFWSEHCSTTHHVLLLRLGTLLLFISPWPMRQSSDGSPSGRLRMGVRSLMMVSLVFHCISFHSNQLRTADLQKKKKNRKSWLQPERECEDQLYPTVQFIRSVAQSCSNLCDPMDCSMPGFPVHHQFPESAQTHVHRVSSAIQPPQLLLSPSPPAFSLSQHQDLFQ